MVVLLLYSATAEIRDLIIRLLFCEFIAKLVVQMSHKQSNFIQPASSLQIDSVIDVQSEVVVYGDNKQWK